MCCEILLIYENLILKTHLDHMRMLAVAMIYVHCKKSSYINVSILINFLIVVHTFDKKMNLHNVTENGAFRNHFLPIVLHIFHMFYIMCNYV